MSYVSLATFLYFNSSGTVDNFVSTYQPPVNCDTQVQVAYLQWTGLFTTQKIQKLYQLLRYELLNFSVPCPIAKYSKIYKHRFYGLSFWSLEPSNNRDM